MRWQDFPDVTDPDEPDYPKDACESELKAAGAGTEPFRTNHTPNEGNESWL